MITVYSIVDHDTEKSIVANHTILACINWNHIASQCRINIYHFTSSDLVHEHVRIFALL